jgi:hypothetical protein
MRHCGMANQHAAKLLTASQHGMHMQTMLLLYEVICNTDETSQQHHE